MEGWDLAAFDTPLGLDHSAENIRKGVEVVVEQDHRPVALIRSPLPKGRLLSECIAMAEARGSTATHDEGFLKDGFAADLSPTR